MTEKAGNLIMKRLHGSTKPSLTTVTKMSPTKSNKPKPQEDYNMILNRLISGNGLKK